MFYVEIRYPDSGENHRLANDTRLMRRGVAIASGGAAVGSSDAPIRRGCDPFPRRLERSADQDRFSDESSTPFAIGF